LFSPHRQTSAPTAACIYLRNTPNLKSIIFSDLPSDYTAVKYSSFQLPFHIPNTFLSILLSATVTNFE